jgi:predicted DNA-binding transcriptional regulator AlpA
MTTKRQPLDNTTVPDGNLSEQWRAISLKTVAELLDTTRSSARRWLQEAGVCPRSLGRGAKGAIRYRWTEVEAWLRSRQHVE